ncbi:MAG TPA: hypothetical protein DDX59_03645 [Lachnospiraceae bacterium]|nr:hypothetical protein [Lachnospiraceae bacterium]
MLNYWISNRENATERGLIIAEWFEPEPRKSRAPLIIVITLLVTAAAIAAAYFGVRLYNASPKVRLSRSLEAAQEALQSGSYAAAEKEYLAALQIDSGNTKAYTGLCDTYAQEENWDQVEQTLEDALSALNKTDGAALISHVISVMMSEADAFSSKKDYSSSAALYLRAQELLNKRMPDDKKAADALKKKIAGVELVLARSSSGQEAIDAWEQVHRNDPDNTEALSALAAAYASAKEYEKASAVLMRLLEIEPGELRHYTDLANVYTAAGDYEKALETLESAKSLDSSSSLESMITNVYAAAARSAEGDKAIGLWKKVIERSPSYVNAYESLADLYAAKGDYTDALRILEEGQEKSGDSVLSGKANVIRQKMAAAGIGDEDGNPLEKLSEALEENRYKDALQQMARRDFMDIIDTLEKQYNEENEISDDADTTKRKVLEITLSGSLVTEEEKSAQEAASSSKKSGKSGSRQSETIKVTLGYLKAFETKTMVVTAADGTRITAYRPAYVDELERTVIGQYGSDQYGYGTYVLADGTALSSVQYVAPLNP